MTRTRIVCLAESAPAVAGESSEASRVPHHDASLRNVARHDRRRPDDGHAADPDSRKHHGTTSDGRAVLDHAFAGHPILVALG